METRLIPMRAPGSRQIAGAHSSDGWDVDTPWHHHDMHQLLYAFEGALEVEGVVGRYTAPKQFAAWVPAGAVHRTKISRLRSGSIFFAPDMIASPLAQAPRIIAVSSLAREMIMHAMRWPLDWALDPAGEAYFKCLAHLVDDWLGAEVHLTLPASDDPQMSAAMAFTREHIADVSFVQVCRHAGMSERSLRRRFRAATGMSWEDFRQRQRIVLAIEALERGAQSVGQIAAEVGYEDQAAFAKAFKAVMGVTPSAYRKAC